MFLTESHLQALWPQLTSQASRMVTMSPLRKASSPGFGRVCSHLVMHWVPGAQRLWVGGIGKRAKVT